MPETKLCTIVGMGPGDPERIADIYWELDRKPSGGFRAEVIDSERRA